MRFLPADKIPALLAELAAAGSEVWAPQVIRDTVNTVLFAPWQEPDEISLDMYTSLSAKELVLPGTERLFSFRFQADGSREEIEIDAGGGPPTARVLFGARVCDARSLSVLDRLFAAPEGRGYQDPGYRSRRGALTVITLACTSCDAACFCSSFGSGPADRTGSDLFLFPVEGGFLAEPVTEAGRSIAASELIEDSSLEPPALAQTARIDPAALRERLPQVFGELELWNRASEKCLSCGYCSYACPACHCFNIFDEMHSDREGERLRGWDSCMFHLYTQETSGHNPRPTPAHRFRNRINHKFNYYPANQGEFLCTGCGRCIRGCPAGVDIRAALRLVLGGEGAGPGTQEGSG